MKKINDYFSAFAIKSTKIAGSSYFFILLIISTIVWLALGPLLNFSDAWQLYCNTISTIITTLLVVLIQNSQNRDSRAFHMKLDELILSKRHADNALINVESLSDEELSELHEKYLKIAEAHRERQTKMISPQHRGIS